MTLDILSLKLRDAEIDDDNGMKQHEVWCVGCKPRMREAADAQFAKLAWGLRDYLEAQQKKMPKDSSTRYRMQHEIDDLTDALEASGVERPTEDQ